jgi:hypothetical protein
VRRLSLALVAVSIVACDGGLRLFESTEERGRGERRDPTR